MPETWRQGRKSGHNIYLQTGEQPSDTDRQIGVMFDPAHAAAAVEAVNAVAQLRAYARWCKDRSVEPDERDILALADGTCRDDYVALMAAGDAHSPAPARTPVSTPTEAHGETGEAQEG